VLFTIAMGFLTLGPVLRPLRFELPRFLLLVAFALFLVSIIDTIAAVARRQTGGGEGGEFDEMVIVVLRRVLRTLVILIAILFLLQNVMGVNVAALILGFGVVALALSLAAQDTVKNLFGAVSIFVNRPFVIGDWIEFKGVLARHWGVVDDIKLQATKIRDVTGNVVTIPNMLFIDREVQNLSARGYIRREVNIAIPYRPDAREAERATKALMDVFTDEEVVADAKSKGREHEPVVAFAEFAEAWLTIRGYHYYYMGDEAGDTQRSTDRSYFTWLDHCTRVNRLIVDTFGERNIEFAFPTQTVELIRGDDRE
jgi:MscS family membrane protein